METIKIGNLDVMVVTADITQIEADAIVVPINPKGIWIAGVNYAIKKVAGDMYHSQAMEQMPLSDLQTIVAKGQPHEGKFRDVVFVVDNLKEPVEKVVYKGLEAAHNQGYTDILVTPMRTGTFLPINKIEKSPDEVLQKLSQGLNDFARNYENTTLRKVTWATLWEDMPEFFTKELSAYQNL